MAEIIPTVVPDSRDDVAHFAMRFAGTAPMVHIDATDGLFAPSSTWLPEQGETLPQQDVISYEAHLMAEEPRVLGERFIRAGAWRISAHQEALGDTEEALQTLAGWRAIGAHEIGVALLIETPLQAAEPLARACDFLLLMTIARIGKQGAPFDTRAFDKVRAAKEMYPNLVIAVDGGVNEENITQLARAGATRFCVGSAESKAPDPVAEYHLLLEAAKSAIQ